MLWTPLYLKLCAYQTLRFRKTKTHSRITDSIFFGGEALSTYFQIASQKVSTILYSTRNKWKHPFYALAKTKNY